MFPRRSVSGRRSTSESSAGEGEMRPLSVFHYDGSLLNIDKGINTVHEGSLHTRVTLLFDKRFGYIWDLFMIFIALASNAVYAYDTYEVAEQVYQNATALKNCHFDYPPHQEPLLSKILGLSFWVFFFFDLALQRVLDTHWYYHWKPLVCQFASLAPIVVHVMNTMPVKTAMVLKAFVSLRIVRAQAARYFKRSIQSEVNRAMWKLVWSILILIYISSVLMFTLALVLPGSFTPCTLYIHDSIYFIVVTATTVGYGDVVASKALTRFAVMGFIAAALYVVPEQVSEVSRLLKLVDPHSGKFRQREQRFVMVTGHVVLDNINSFYGEFYHPDREVVAPVTTQMLVMAPEMPSVEFIRFVSARSRIHFHTGSFSNDDDLKRLAASRADVFFVMVNQFGDPEREDQAALLRCLALKKAFPQIPVHTQLCQISKLGLVRRARIDQCVCLNQFRLGLLAITALHPGMCTLVRDLVTSSSEDETATQGTWQSEYMHGSGHEIYVEQFDTTFLGAFYADVVQWIYQQKGILLIGVISLDGSVLLNPTDPDFCLLTGHRAILIATQRTDALLVRDHQWDPSFSSLPLSPSLNRNLRPSSAALRRSDSSIKILHEEARSPTMSVSFSALADPKVAADIRNNRAHSIPVPKFLLNKQVEGLEHLECIADAHHLSQHIVVCGFPRSVEELVRPLRNKHVEIHHPIVFIDHEGPSEACLRAFSLFHSLFWLRGSPTSEHDLSRCNLLNCKAVVVVNSKPVEMAVEQDLIDAETVLIDMAIKEKYHDTVHVVTEIVDVNSLRFLWDHNEEQQDMSDSILAVTASGMVYQSDIFDSLLVQTWYNPFIVAILNRLFFGVIEKKHEARTTFESEFYCDPVPNSYTQAPGRSFDALATDLMTRGVVIIGLYRRSPHGPFVFTNPPKSAILKEGDHMYVLRPPHVGMLTQKGANLNSDTTTTTTSSTGGSSSSSSRTNAAPTATTATTTAAPSAGKSISFAPTPTTAATTTTPTNAATTTTNATTTTTNATNATTNATNATSATTTATIDGGSRSSVGEGEVAVSIL